MKKTITFMLMILALGVQFNISSCKSSKSSAEKKAITYVCPMHPDVTSDKPGKCPKCGMDLVEKK